MSPPEPLTPVCAEHLVALHRYATLLTGGDPAATATAVDATLDRAAARSGDIRCPLRSARWLFAEVRVECRRRVGRKGVNANPESNAAAPFARLPEPERAALGLFYVGPFRRLELADTLGVRPEDLGPLLMRARTLLLAQMPAASEEPLPEPAGADGTAVPDGALAVG